MFTNKPPCGPKRGHGTPQPRFGQEIQLDKIAAKLALDPADLRLNMVAKPDSLTANWLRIGTIGLAECIRVVVARSGLEGALRQAARRPRPRPRLRRLHVRRRPVDLLEQAAALGRAVADRPQRPGHGVLRRDGNRAGLRRCPRRHRRRSARHRPVRSPLRDRRHRPHADRPRLVFEPRHRDDGQRRDRGRRQASRHARRAPPPKRCRRCRSGSCWRKAVCSAPTTRARACRSRKRW